jgi:glycosyltransferase involved in cell wall biosynthesis
MSYRHLLVAVPARNEARTIRALIESVDAAAGRVEVPVVVVIAADSCSDATADIARAAAAHQCEVVVIDGRWGKAGAARAAAVDHGLAMIPSDRPAWIANTDADCVVPPTWLATHIDLCAHTEAIGGIVQLHPDTTEAPLLVEFEATYQLHGDHHPHVHGANIGLSADAYRSVGGWCRRTEVGEDHVLWNSLVARGHRVRQATALSVFTSARVRSRVLGGFATNLAHLQTPASAVPAHV